MNFFQTLMPEVHPVLNDLWQAQPLVFELDPVAKHQPGTLSELIAAELPDDKVDGVRAISQGRIRAADVLRKPPRFPGAAAPKSGPFGLLETMPASYAGVMFGIGWILLLISLALGYMGRHTTPYSANDPATWDPEVRRPLAAIVTDLRSA
jgi:hypothetical protein